MPPMLDSHLCRVLRDVIPPTPPGPEGSNGNGLVWAQWVARPFPLTSTKTCPAGRADCASRGHFVTCNRCRGT